MSCLFCVVLHNTVSRDLVISTCHDLSLKKKLLKEKDLTSEKVLNTGKEHEAVAFHAREMDVKKSSDKPDRSEETEQINSKYHYKTDKHHQSCSKRDSDKQQHENSKRHTGKSRYNLCFKCGSGFVPGHLKHCPAIGRTCYSCGKLNHLAIVCQSQSNNR